MSAALLGRPTVAITAVDDESAPGDRVAVACERSRASVVDVTVDRLGELRDVPNGPDHGAERFSAGPDAASGRRGDEPARQVSSGSHSRSPCGCDAGRAARRRTLRGHGDPDPSRTTPRRRVVTVERR
jgi:hypothetical protein